MTITALPPAPSTNDPSTFDSKADALIAALPTFVTETNAVAVAMNLNSTTDTSASSVLIGTGAKTFTVTAGKSFQPGMYLVCADTAAPSANSMYCQVTSYSGTTLIVNSLSVAGSGTKTAWVISQSAGGASGFAAIGGSTTQDFAAKKLTLGAGSLIESEGAAVTAASSTNIWAGDGNTVHVTGNTGIADFATAPQAGAWMKVIFDGTPLLTQSANLDLNAGGANIQIASGDFALVYADTTTQMKVFVTKKAGTAVLQVLTATLSTLTSGNSVIPLDTTIPQNTEGTEVLTLAITPLSTTSKIIVMGRGTFAANTAANMIAALFKDAAADAIASGQYTSSSASFHGDFGVYYEETSGSLTARTFKLRVGQALTATWYLNGHPSYTLGGNTYRTNIIIMEVTA